RTGYQSNLRPPVYYSPNLDRLDNPSMGLLLRNNYMSMTSRDFCPMQLPTGREPLAYTVYPPQSGYADSNKITNPKFRNVKSVHFDTRDHGAVITPGIRPKHQPILTAQRGKGGPETENFRHRGYHRMMGQSLTKTDFLPLTTLQPGDSRNSTRQNLDTLGQVFVGKQEPSGYNQNNLLYVQPPLDPPQQYLTNYNMRFTDPKPIGKDRKGWTRGGIQEQNFSGFSVNNEDHIPGI
ncbi:hypothetical protein GDO86_008759, partial [Hymenochirus boettgeri]